jgi:ribose 1,5-bisphosphokinase
VLVTGPSGAGKDTLIDLARATCADDRGIVFPRRIVTRDASTSEDNGAVTPTQFAEALAREDFALHWQAHGLRYGLLRAIIDDIREGRIVVANVSRTVVAAARAAFSNVVVVLVTAPPEVLAARLVARARISDGPVEDRLRRTVANGVPDITINNVGNPADHAGDLLKAIRDG